MKELKWFEPEAPSPPWIELPEDLTINILGRLDVIERLHIAQKVCTTWRAVCRYYPHMWRVIHMEESSHDLTPRHLDILCRRAVDRSQGQLVDISMKGFCTNGLIRYIAKRCRQLQSLRIKFRYKVTGKAFYKALKKFTHLNELHLLVPYKTLSHFHSYYNFDVEEIGRSCPKLKSFIYFHRKYMFSGDPINDADALAVAKSMCGLRTLCLSGDNVITGRGLDAIVNGCPHLETLVIRLSPDAYGSSKDILERCRPRQFKSVWLNGFLGSAYDV